ncbi:cytochrome c maturation protein CcmE [Cryomorpha ignava]|uniref:Cytochrome c maturation protein CcmE n=1 Tax=Cryomorpha ignava TaxID=101383 RepID=A0A7K3WQM3_9FLAO|nr:cytochrome c maturation protein CcmE [Cryomorpha ignava]NEN23957.1 cytochrome c maturation protein CcmE [Cryomorpha ignava]
MKKTHIVGIVIIAVAVAFILSSVSKSSSYAEFDDAFSNPGKEYHVVGTLDKTADIIYNPELNANLTQFTMIDGKGEKRTVMLNKSKPQDFERSESVVIIGKANGENFHASEMLMKCPSKYKQEGKFNVDETAAK